MSQFPWRLAAGYAVALAVSAGAGCGGGDDGPSAGGDDVGGDVLDPDDAMRACQSMCDVEAACSWHSNPEGCVEACVEFASAARGDFVVEWTGCVAALTCDPGEDGAMCGGDADCASGMCAEVDLGLSLCARPCDDYNAEDDGCPIGFDCAPASIGSGESHHCEPDRSSCEPEVTPLPIHEEWARACRNRLAECGESESDIVQRCRVDLVLLVGSSIVEDLLACFEEECAAIRACELEADPRS